MERRTIVIREEEPEPREASGAARTLEAAVAGLRSALEALAGGTVIFDAARRARPADRESARALGGDPAAGLSRVELAARIAQLAREAAQAFDRVRPGPAA